MFNVLTGLALGIVIFAITIGVGVVVLGKFSASVDSCGSNAGDLLVYNQTDGFCSNSTDSGVQVQGTATTTVRALEGEMGTTGLAGWTGAIIALAVGLLFIGALMGKRKY